MSDIRKAATVVCLRDGEAGLEVLLMRRNPDVRVLGGAWVFPGGRVDTQDVLSDSSEEATARRAAVREAEEEASISLDGQALQPISHWTTPPQEKRRFATWFFVADAADQEVQVDGEEMIEHRWLEPAEALRQHREDAWAMMPPTVVTLHELSLCKSVGSAKAFFADRDMPFIAPKILAFNDSFAALYPGDAGYDNEDPSSEGARNRCRYDAGVWYYEYSGHN